MGRLAWTGNKSSTPFLVVIRLGRLLLTWVPRLRLAIGIFQARPSIRPYKFTHSFAHRNLICASSQVVSIERMGQSDQRLTCCDSLRERSKPILKILHPFYLLRIASTLPLQPGAVGSVEKCELDGGGYHAAISSDLVVLL